jgi:hypothetical protein
MQTFFGFARLYVVRKQQISPRIRQIMDARASMYDAVY